MICTIPPIKEFVVITPLKTIGVVHGTETPVHNGQRPVYIKTYEIALLTIGVNSMGMSITGFSINGNPNTIGS